MWFSRLALKALRHREYEMCLRCEPFVKLDVRGSTKKKKHKNGEKARKKEWKKRKIAISFFFFCVFFRLTVIRSFFPHYPQPLFFWFSAFRFFFLCVCV